MQSDPQPPGCGETTGDVVTIPGPTHRTATVAGDERSRRIWSAGEYDRIAAGFRDGAAAFVARRGLGPGRVVLDAACGSGNVTIPAARTGAAVVGFDLVPSLLAAAARWAEAERLTVRFDEGTVEALPYREAAFDLVTSMFGVMFAAAPARVVAELARVTRPGGQVALANWTPRGFVGEMLAIHAGHVPPPPGAASPLHWGDEPFLRDLFDERAWQLGTTMRSLKLRYPHTPAGTAELFRAAYGPTVRAYEALDEDGRASLASALAAHWTKHQRAGGATTEVEAEYLEVVATRR